MPETEQKVSSSIPLSKAATTDTVVTSSTETATSNTDTAATSPTDAATSPINTATTTSSSDTITSTLDAPATTSSSDTATSPTDVSTSETSKAEDGNKTRDNQENNSIDEDYPEEMPPDESYESFETKYQVSNEGISAVGDNARINISYYIQIMEETKRTSNENVVTKDAATSKKNELIEKALTSARQISTFSVNLADNAENPDAKPPDGQEQLSKWYYKLDEYEQCYVQAAAILHGGPADEVSKRADNLYTLRTERTEKYNNTSIKTQTELQTEPIRFLSHNRSSKILQSKTYTFTQRVEGIERLFWSDTDIYGISSFGLRLLDFLAGEFLSKGAHGQDFRTMLQNWSQERQSEQYLHNAPASGASIWHQNVIEETSLRCARALGVFLWRQNVEELRKMAHAWAKNRNLSGWRRTAMLLDGAYEIDSINYPRTTSETEKSPILKLVNEWVNRCLKMQNLTDIYLGCAAANTYGLIGMRNPDDALQGLDQLLQIPSKLLSEIDTNTLFAAIASAYVSLCWSGHIKKVLTHLACSAEQSILQHNRPNKLSERYTYRQQCEVKLTVTLEIFFLIIADSLSERSTRTIAAYQEPLPDSPSLSDPLGRDVLLAGILAEDNCRWRDQIITLLCAAIIERQNRLMAFDVIQRWAEIVQSIRGEQTEPSKVVTDSYINFMISLGKTINFWCDDVRVRQGRLLKANVIYRKRLELWSKGEGFISKFTNEVLSQLKS